MKKLKYMALVLVMMLGLIGAGYAAWEEELEIGGTVETGTFNIEFTETGIENIAEHMELSVGIKDGDPNTVEFDIKNMYPQNQGDDNTEFFMRFESKGSVPVKFESVSLEGVDNEKIWNHLRYQLGGPAIDQWPQGYLKDLADEIEAQFEDVKLKKNDDKKFHLYVWLEDNEDAPTGEKVDFDLVMNWKQFNLVD